MPTVPISVVICAYNGERFIRQAIRSVQNQTVKVAEIIVVDDYCSDNTAEIAKEMGAIVLPKPEHNQGIPAARNRGILASSGEWIALLDQDDFWEKRKIEYQWEAIKACPDAGLISCYSRIYRSDKIIEDGFENYAGILSREYFLQCSHRVKINKYCSYFPLTPDSFEDGNRDTGTVILKREVFEKVGLFDENLTLGEDTEFFLRVLHKFPWVLVQRRLSSYRRHNNNFTRNNKQEMSQYFAFVNKVLQNPELYPSCTQSILPQAAKYYFYEKGKMLADAKSSKHL